MMIAQSTKQDWENTLLTLAQEGLETHATSFSPVHSAPIDQLSAAYAQCEALTTRHSRSFYIATALLPKAKRRAARALYAYCRLADDIVDGGQEQPAMVIAQLRESIRRPKAGAQVSEPTLSILAAWEDARTRYRVPLRYAEQLLDGVEKDLCQTHYKTFEELAVYCYGVASTVGLMSMHIIGFEQGATPYAVKIGVALQLTNILRDMGEGWRNGRLYLPLEELARFGLGEVDIASQHVDDRWRALMRFQIARNRRLYAEAMPGIAHLDRRGRLAAAAAAVLYQGILDDIEAHDYDVFSRRAHVSEFGKIRRITKILAHSRGWGGSIAPFIAGSNATNFPG
jgi:phytoene synthase